MEQALKVQELDIHRLDGATVRSAELLALCRQQPAVSGMRFIVVDQAHRLEAAAVEALLQHAAVIVQTSQVVLLSEAESGARHALAKVGSAILTERFEPESAEAVKPFALTEALGRGDISEALKVLHEQMLSGKEPLEVLGLIAWQLQRWVVVKRLAASGYNSDRIAAASGMRPWQAQRIQSEVTRRSLHSLQELLERCWRLDVEVKTGRTIAEVALDRMVVEICRARN